MVRMTSITYYLQFSYSISAKISNQMLDGLTSYILEEKIVLVIKYYLRKCCVLRCGEVNM